MEDGGRLPVYLIHWNAPEWCASAARSVLDSQGIEVDLTVIDNGQLGGTALTELLPPQARVLAMTDNRGYTGGANAGLSDWRDSYPAAELCVIASHDLHVEPRTLAALVKVATNRPDAGVVAPTIVSPYIATGGRWDGRRSFQLGLGDEGDVVERDWASGSCLLIRAACADDVGMFDERLGSYIEDVDYGLRVRDHGWKVLVVTSAHISGFGSSAPDAAKRVATNTVLLNAKRRGWRGASSSLTLFAGWTIKGYVASVAPWRDATHRARSRRYATQRTAGLYEVFASGKLWRLLREERKNANTR